MSMEYESVLQSAEIGGVALSVAYWHFGAVLRKTTCTRLTVTRSYSLYDLSFWDRCVLALLAWRFTHTRMGLEACITTIGNVANSWAAKSPITGTWLLGLPQAHVYTYAKSVAAISILFRLNDWLGIKTMRPPYSIIPIA